MFRPGAPGLSALACRKAVGTCDPRLLMCNLLISTLASSSELPVLPDVHGGAEERGKHQGGSETAVTEKALPTTCVVSSAGKGKAEQVNSLGLTGLNNMVGLWGIVTPF